MAAEGGRMEAAVADLIMAVVVVVVMEASAAAVVRVG